MRKSAVLLFRPLRSRPFSTTEAHGSDNKVASVLFERLPVVIPKIDPVVYAFHEFSLRWGQQYRKKYPDEVLGKGAASVRGSRLLLEFELFCWFLLLLRVRGKGDYQIDFVPAPRITEADRTNDRKSLKRALDRRLYLLLYGSTCGTNNKKSVWHFPEKVYENEDTMRLCAESALKSVLRGLDHTYFVGNAPFAHMTILSTEISPDSPNFKRFFFKSQVIGTTKLNIGNCEDHVWVTKDELMDYFPEQAEFLSKMIIS